MNEFMVSYAVQTKPLSGREEFSRPEDNIMISTSTDGKGHDVNVTLIDYGIVKTCENGDSNVEETQCHPRSKKQNCCSKTSSW